MPEALPYLFHGGKLLLFAGADVTAGLVTACFTCDSGLEYDFTSLWTSPVDSSLSHLTVITSGI
jgi:hypothetical protein